MSQTLTFSFLLLTAVACAGQPVHTFSGFTLAEVRDVSKALAPLHKLKPRQTDFFLYESLGPKWGAACLGCDPCEIHLSKEIHPAYLEAVVWHEYGHCLGFKHERTGVMRPSPVPLTPHSRQKFLERIRGY